ncbi:uncharacterized protein C18orf63 homolog [Polymixia lowei]
MSGGREQSLFFVSVPDLKRLCCLTVSLHEDEGQLRDKQIKTCRELVLLYSDILASPALDSFTEITLVMAILFYKTGIIQDYGHRHNLQLGLPQRVLPGILQCCVSYSLSTRLTPFWNKAGPFLISGKDFLTENGRLNAVRKHDRFTFIQFTQALTPRSCPVPPTGPPGTSREYLTGYISTHLHNRRVGSAATLPPAGYVCLFVYDVHAFCMCVCVCVCMYLRFCVRVCVCVCVCVAGMELSTCENQLCISVKASNVRLTPTKLEDFGISPVVLKTFCSHHDAVLHSTSMGSSNWCYVLPSMKRGQIISISRQLPRDSPFKTYTDLQNHWNSLYGYRLPELVEGEVVYCWVYFKLVGERLFTYPLSCIRLQPVQCCPRVDLQGALGSFLSDVRDRLQSVCGFPVRMTSTPSYHTTSLTSTASAQMLNGKAVNLTSKWSSRPVLTQFPAPAPPPEKPSFRSQLAARPPLTQQAGGRSCGGRQRSSGSGGEEYRGDGLRGSSQTHSQESPSLSYSSSGYHSASSLPSSSLPSFSSSLLSPAPPPPSQTPVIPAPKLVPIFKNRSLTRHVNVTQLLAHKQREQRRGGEEERGRVTLAPYRKKRPAPAPSSSTTFSLSGPTFLSSSSSSSVPSSLITSSSSSFSMWPHGPQIPPLPSVPRFTHRPKSAGLITPHPSRPLPEPKHIFKPNPKPSASFSPRPNPNPKPSASFSPRPNPNPKPSASFSPRPNPNPKPSASFSPRPNPNPKPSASFSPRPNPNPKPSASFSPRPNPNPKPSASFSPRPNPNPKPSASFSPRPNPNPKPSASFSPRLNPKPSASFSPRPNPKPSASFSPRPNPKPSPTSSQTLGFISWGVSLPPPQPPPQPPRPLVPSDVPSNRGGDRFESKPKRTRSAMQDLDVERMAKTNQLSKVNSATLLAWLRGRGVVIRSKHRKEELMLKVMGSLAEA